MFNIGCKRIFRVLGKYGFLSIKGENAVQVSGGYWWEQCHFCNIYTIFIFFIYMYIFFLSFLVFNGFSWILLNWLLCFNMYQALMNKISSNATVLLTTRFVLKLLINAGKGTQNGLHNILFLFSDNSWLIYDIKNIGRK